MTMKRSLLAPLPAVTRKLYIQMVGMTTGDGRKYSIRAKAVSSRGTGLASKQA